MLETVIAITYYSRSEEKEAWTCAATEEAASEPAPGAIHTAVAAAALAAAPRMMNIVSDAAVVAAAISAIPAREPTL